MIHWEYLGLAWKLLFHSKGSYPYKEIEREADTLGIRTRAYADAYKDLERNIEKGLIVNPDYWPTSGNRYWIPEAGTRIIGVGDDNGVEFIAIGNATGRASFIPDTYNKPFPLIAAMPLPKYRPN